MTVETLCINAGKYQNTQSTLYCVKCDPKCLKPRVVEIISGVTANDPIVRKHWIIQSYGTRIFTGCPECFDTQQDPLKAVNDFHQTILNHSPIW